MRDHPVDQWQTQWDLERILDALREFYPLRESERFVNKEERWEAALKALKGIPQGFHQLPHHHRVPGGGHARTASSKVG